MSATTPRVAAENEARLDRYARALDARDAEPEPESEPGEGDMPLIAECKACGNPGYLCVCDWLDGLEFAP